MDCSGAPFSLALQAAVAATFLFLLSHPAEATRHRHFAVFHAAGGLRGGAAFLCSHTDYPEQCMSAAQATRGRPAGPADLTLLTIQAAILKAQQAKAEAERLHATASRPARGNLDTCRQSYNSALADLQTSMKALQSGSPADLQINLSAVITDVSTCDDGFADSGSSSPLAGASGDIHKFASNGLALTDMMNHHH